MHVSVGVNTALCTCTGSIWDTLHWSLELEFMAWRSWNLGAWRHASSFQNRRTAYHAWVPVLVFRIFFNIESSCILLEKLFCLFSSFLSSLHELIIMIYNLPCVVCPWMAYVYKKLKFNIQEMSSHHHALSATMYRLQPINLDVTVF